MTDAVEKGFDSTVVLLDAAFDCCYCYAVSSGVEVDAATDAYATDATNAGFPSDGGPRNLSASVLRFCTMAARWNSSRAPERPRSRMRSKRWWVFRCARRISIFLACLLDRSNSALPFSTRA